MNNFKKTGQMEMIGLVIIVFLLSLGMFFLVTITNKDNAESTSLNTQNADLGQNMIDAIKYIKLDCPPPYGKRIGIDDLIKDMATDNQIYCNLAGNWTNSTEYARIAISNILNKTLSNWSKSYAFTIIKDEGKSTQAIYLSMSSYGCTMLSEGNPGIQPFPLRGSGTVAMKLHICS